MDPNAMQLATDFADPLIRLKYFGPAAAESIPFTDLLLGKQIGGLGATQVGALFLGGSFLAARGIIRWQISLGFFLGVVGLAALYNMLDPAVDASPFFPSLHRLGDAGRLLSGHGDGQCALQAAAHVHLRPDGRHADHHHP